MMRTDLMVVETEDDIFLGTVDFANEVATIRTGWAGHPIQVHVQEIVCMTLASAHPEVETVDG